MTVLDVAGTRFERTLLSRPGSAPDTTSRVTWLQGDNLYCDLRRPASAVRVSPIPLGAMSIEDLIVLTEHDGFGGRLLDHGSHVEWARAVGFRPAGPLADAGTLDLLDADTVVEYGVFEDYTEHWRIAATSPRIEECLLTDADTGASGILIRVGDDFAFARGRTTALAADPLVEQIRGASTLRAAQELLDCEISLGRIELGRWRISASTLPHRVGAVLDPETTDGITTRDVDVDGRPTTRRWRRLEIPADTRSAS